MRVGHLACRVHEPQLEGGKGGEILGGGMPLPETKWDRQGRRRNYASKKNPAGYWPLYPEPMITGKAPLRTRSNS